MHYIKSVKVPFLPVLFSFSLPMVIGGKYHCGINLSCGAGYDVKAKEAYLCLFGFEVSFKYMLSK